MPHDVPHAEETQNPRRELLVALNRRPVKLVSSLNRDNRIDDWRFCEILKLELRITRRVAAKNRVLVRGLRRRLVCSGYRRVRVLVRYSERGLLLLLRGY